ncbi:hypothetical protein H4I96_05977 [Botrytis cinerea]
MNGSGDAYQHGLGALGLSENVSKFSPVSSITQCDEHQLEQTGRYRSTVSKANLSDVRDPDPSMISEEDSSAVTVSRLLGLDRVDWKGRLFCLPVVQPQCPSNVVSLVPSFVIGDILSCLQSSICFTMTRSTMPLIDTSRKQRNKDSFNLRHIQAR